jgi:hypothetical protein
MILASRLLRRKVQSYTPGNIASVTEEQQEHANEFRLYLHAIDKLYYDVGSADVERFCHAVVMQHESILIHQVHLIPSGISRNFTAVRTS